MPKKRRRILEVQPRGQPRQNITSGREAAANRIIGRRTARANIMDLNQNEVSHRANHLDSNNVQTGHFKHHSNRSSTVGIGNVTMTTSGSTSTTIKLEPRRDPICKLPQQNMAKKSITSETVKLPERTSLLSSGM